MKEKRTNNPITD